MHSRGDGRARSGVECNLRFCSVKLANSLRNSQFVLRAAANATAGLGPNGHPYNSEEARHPFLSTAVFHGDTCSFWCVVWALGLYKGAVLAEVFRAGILAVPPGQGEAAYAVGMRKSQVMIIVLLPQAVKIMIPAIISQCVVALKDTSLGFAIAAPGLTAVARPLYLEFQNHVPVYVVVAAIYIVINIVLTVIAIWVQKKFVGEKKVLQVAMVGEGDPTAKAPH